MKKSFDPSTTPSAETAATPPKQVGESDRLHNRDYLKPRRRTLRRNLTPAEAFLWSSLKNSNLDGRKFRRQHSIYNYILDFYCDAERLGVELDGEFHTYDLTRENDAERTHYLKQLGIKVIRFENFLVFQELEYVLHHIANNFGWWKTSRTTTPSAETAATPPKQGGEF